VVSGGEGGEAWQSSKIVSMFLKTESPKEGGENTTGYEKIGAGIKKKDQQSL